MTTAKRHKHIWVAIVTPPKNLPLKFKFKLGAGDYYCMICGVEKYADA